MRTASIHHTQRTAPDKHNTTSRSKVIKKENNVLRFMIAWQHIMYTPAHYHKV